MGGHGGLNILPQKSWNVYNRDNRLKVARDEAKAKQQEDELNARHEHAEREHRHQQLLKRTKQPAEVVEGQAAALPVEGAAGAAALPSTSAHAEGHFNFWKEEELQQQHAQHPENEKQQKDELRRRGNPDTYTSDAKFDERFKFGYDMAATPWYARPLQEGRHEPDKQQAALPAAGPPQSLAASGKPLPALMEGSRRQRSRKARSPSPSSSGSSSSSSDDGRNSNSDSSSSGGRRRRRSSKPSKRKDKKSKKKAKHTKHRSSHRGGGGSSGGGALAAPAGKSVEQLRAERLQRERQEQQKARLVLVGAYQLDEGPQKEYNSAYGFAPNKKRRTD